MEPLLAHRLLLWPGQVPVVKMCESRAETCVAKQFRLTEPATSSGTTAGALGPEENSCPACIVGGWFMGPVMALTSGGADAEHQEHAAAVKLFGVWHCWQAQGSAAATTANAADVSLEINAWLDAAAQLVHTTLPSASLELRHTGQDTPDMSAASCSNTNLALAKMKVVDSNHPAYISDCCGFTSCELLA